MKEEVWNLRIHDSFCLDCENIMEYYGYEKGGNLDEGKIIDSDIFETDNYEPHIFLNFKCSQCMKKISVMTH